MWIIASNELPLRPAGLYTAALKRITFSAEVASSPRQLCPPNCVGRDHRRRLGIRENGSGLPPVHRATSRLYDCPKQFRVLPALGRTFAICLHLDVYKRKMPISSEISESVIRSPTIFTRGTEYESNTHSTSVNSRHRRSFDGFANRLSFGAGRRRARHD